MAVNNRNRSDHFDQSWNRNQDSDYRQHSGSHGNQYSHGNDWQRTGHGNRYDENYKWDQPMRNTGDRNQQPRSGEQHNRITGPHRGKGPKDYRRSEQRIREDVCDRLSEDDMVDATNIIVQIEGDEVILTGSVTSREQKRRAEDLVERISGVNNVENRIRVENSVGTGIGSRDDSGMSGRSESDTGNRNEPDMSNYTGTSDNIGGIGDESGTTSEIIRNVRNNR